MGDSGAVVIVMIASVCAPLLADRLSRFRIPTTVLEIMLGILIGPALLGWVDGSSTELGLLSNLGLSALFFLAGMEVDIGRVRGTALNRAGLAWGFSLVMGLAIGFAFASFGLALSGLVVGLALTTTALGTLLPIFRDAGEIDTPFGTFVLAGGAIGEFGPIVAVALLLSGDNPAHEGLLLVVFAALAVGAAMLALRPLPARVQRVMGATLNSSGHLAVRICLTLLLLMVWIAAEFGLDALLGAFAAGAVVRLLLSRDANHGEVEQVVSKLEGLGYGFLVPIFFVASGVGFDVDALFSSASTLLRVPLFAALFLVVRGVPTYLVHRGMLPRERLGLSVVMGTALPLVVAITEIATETGRIRVENAVALVGAGMLSVLLFPTIGLAIKGGRAEVEAGDEIGVFDG
jgi:Kef-type K+ transport system membrane component KefB